MSATSPARDARRVRAELGHPVVDVDGHVLEYLPAVEPYLADALGPRLFQRWRTERRPDQLFTGHADLAERRRTRVPQGNWWGTPAANTRDLATAVLPALLRERIDEFGIDYAVLYPSKALGCAGIADEEMRRGVCRAFNTYFAETYAPYRDRFTVAGVVPMHAPEEAVAEIEHCAALGLKVVAMPEGVLRPIPEPGRGRSPVLLPDQGWWLDTYGLDSAADYDPVWAACGRLRLPVSFHAGLGTLAPAVAPSISNYVANHVGRFAQRMAAVVTSLVLGGVTHRFPATTFAFLECGVGWAAILLSDLVEHYEKRNLDHLRRHLDPALVDYDALAGWMGSHGHDLARRGADLEAGLRGIPAVGTPPPEPDEWAAAGIGSVADVVERFAPRLFFGCEADDPTTAFAFSPALPHGARLRPVFSSDIGHWDVTDMADVLVEAHGLVERGLLTEGEFAEFVFGNPVALLAGTDPDFFAGTPVAAQAAAELARQRAAGPAQPVRS